MQNDDTRNEHAQSAGSGGATSHTDPPTNRRPPPSSSTSNEPSRNSIFVSSIPRPLKALFDRFPIHTYPPNALTLRSPSSQRDNTYTDTHEHRHTLYVFTTAAGATAGEPSYNPGCLKWQTLLKFHGVPFATRPSTNHAAPGGVLPFLLLDPTITTSAGAPDRSISASVGNAIPASKLEAWLHTQTPKHPPPRDHRRHPHPQNPLAATYPSLLTPIRHAYLHALYLSPSTFASLATPLYIDPCSRSVLVRAALGRPLRAAALEQLVLGAPGAGGVGVGAKVDVEGAYAAAEEAVDALSEILGRGRWFAAAGAEGDSERGGDNEEEDEDEEEEEEKEVEGKGTTKPGTLDAAIFAYTHPILEHFSRQPEGTPARRLARALQRHQNLVAHRERILRDYYGR